MGFSMAIGVGGGMYLDSRFDTKPLFLWIGFILGLGAAFKALVDVARSAKKVMSKDESSPTDED